MSFQFYCHGFGQLKREIINWVSSFWVKWTWILLRFLQIQQSAIHVMWWVCPSSESSSWHSVGWDWESDVGWLFTSNSVTHTPHPTLICDAESSSWQVWFSVVLCQHLWFIQVSDNAHTLSQNQQRHLIFRKKIMYSYAERCAWYQISWLSWSYFLACTHG
jgi:hypothetical protein